MHRCGVCFFAFDAFRCKSENVKQHLTSFEMLFRFVCCCCCCCFIWSVGAWLGYNQCVLRLVENFWQDFPIHLNTSVCNYIRCCFFFKFWKGSFVDAHANVNKVFVSLFDHSTHECSFSLSNTFFVVNILPCKSFTRTHLSCLWLSNERKNCRHNHHQFSRRLRFDLKESRWKMNETDESN